MLQIPEDTLNVYRVVTRAMSQHTFTVVQPSKYGIENQEVATAVGVKWRGQYLLLTAGHVVDYCQEDTLCFFLPARNLDYFSTPARNRPLRVELRGLVQLAQPTPPVFADHPIDLAAIHLPPQPGADDCFAVLEDTATMPTNGSQVGVFGYPGAVKIPIGKNFMATPEHFFGPLNLTHDACKHPPEQDFTIPYELDHAANGYSGSGVWCWPEEPIWSPLPRLCGIVGTQCNIDKIVSGFKIETVIKFLLDNDDLLIRP